VALRSLGLPVSSADAGAATGARFDLTYML